MNKKKFLLYLVLGALAIVAVFFELYAAFGLIATYVPAVTFGVVFAILGSFALPWPGPLQETDRSISWRRCGGAAVLIFGIAALFRCQVWVAFAAGVALLVLAGVLGGLVTISEIQALATRYMDDKAGIKPAPENPANSAPAAT
jgi:hypothetical protein